MRGRTGSTWPHHRVEEIAPVALNVLIHLRDVVEPEPWPSDLTPPRLAGSGGHRGVSGEGWTRWWERLALAHAVAYCSSADFRPAAISWLGEIVNRELAQDLPTLAGSPALRELATTALADARRRAATAPRRTPGSIVERVVDDIASSATAAGLHRTLLVVDVPGTWSRALAPSVSLVGADACADERTVRALLLGA